LTGWAIFGKVDIVAVASGKVVSHQRTQVVQPFETATVGAVLVRPGQRVKAGDPVIELDATAALAERDHARNDLTAGLLDQMRLTAFLAGQPDAAFATVPGATAFEAERAHQSLVAQLASQASQIASLSQEKLQRQAERQSLLQTSGKIEDTLPMVAERADIRIKAAAMGNSSILAKLESEQLLVETKAELQINRSKTAALDAAILSLDQKMIATQADIRTNAMAELSKAQDRVRSAHEALAKALHRVSLQTLKAPVTGIVQQLRVVTAGSVVTPAQQLLSIAPDDDDLEVEAVLENRDIGFVAKGQTVELKVDAFPFTRYGLIKGTVVSVDRDAEASPTNQSNVQGAQRLADETDYVESSERLRYTVRIAVPVASLNVDGREAAIVPGMSIKAEILTGRRRIIDFVLAPLREHAHDALRDR
jgi:HlyD family secretion protein/hemolysin D